MGSVSSEEGSDQHRRRCCGSYSLSADVSESESSGCFPYHDDTASTTSLRSSPVPNYRIPHNNALPNPGFLPPTLIFPGIHAKDMMLHPHKRDAPLSGSFIFFFFSFSANLMRIMSWSFQFASQVFAHSFLDRALLLRFSPLISNSFPHK